MIEGRFRACPPVTLDQNITRCEQLMKIYSSQVAERHQYVRIALIAFTIAFWLPMTANVLLADEAEPTVAELLKQYEQSIASYHHFKGEWRTECSRVTQKGNPGQYYDTGADGGKETRFAKIWRDNGRARVLVVVDRGNGKEDPIETVCVKDKQWLQLRQIAVSAKMKTNTSDFANALSLATPTMAFGTIFGEDLPEFVAPLTLSKHKEDSRYYVIRGEPGDHSFDIELWFDSNQSNALAKAKYTSHSTYDPNEAHSERRLNFEWTLSGFQKTDGVFVPSQVIWKVLTPSYRMEGPSGNDFITLPPTEDVFDSLLVSIEFSPKLSDADLGPSIVIADGTPVRMLDAQHLSFEWQSGKIVPAGTKAMKTLRNTKFLGGSGSGRFWLTILNAALLIALILYFSLKPLRKPRERVQ